MASQGPLSPTTVGEIDAERAIWVNDSNALTNDGTTADSVVTIEEGTNYLQFSDYGFTIPLGATIDSILIECNWWYSVVGSSDGFVIVVPGDAIPLTISDGTITPPETYESCNDPDAAIRTPTDVNSLVTLIWVEDLNPVTLHIDHIRVTVLYTPPLATKPPSSLLHNRIGIGL